MNITDFQEMLFRQGEQYGYTDMEIYYSGSRAISVVVRQSEVDTYRITETNGLSFRGVIGGKMGYAFTEKIAEDSMMFLLEEAEGNAAVLEMEDDDELFAGSEQYPQLNTYSALLMQTDPDILIQAAQKVERAVLASDERISMVRQSAASVREHELLIANTRGLHCHQQDSVGSVSVYLLAGEGQDTVTGGWFEYSLTDFSEIQLEQIAARAVEETVSKLGAASVPSDNYPVILREDAASSLLQTHASIFSAENVEKGFSSLVGKLGQRIAGSNITLIDDPLMPGVPGASIFDAEGVAARRNELIQEGTLMTFLHNRKTAAKAGAETTGNASKGGYKGKIGVSYHNLYLQPGTRSLDELIASTERGILITELQGLHAGTNPTSGNFSLACLGYLIENGKISRPVNQITVSGNFYDLLGEVEELGNDLRFTGSCTSPSLKIASLSISGS
ncbi:TldD/PmbA family protein [Paenibacillus bovis]|uniref:Zn-dependent protease n=1 Tax=Paenibacillus bovis TaxID=1616788 RepID=A0A172ZJP5_9BACL|nr:TldD/PmbA family protein [Paenibacillus bovis]ANF97497.1 Zn-dependent protease [Paenibacillus bovis]